MSGQGCRPARRAMDGDWRHTTGERRVPRSFKLLPIENVPQLYLLLLARACDVIENYDDRSGLGDVPDAIERLRNVVLSLVVMP